MGSVHDSGVRAGRRPATRPGTASRPETVCARPALPGPTRAVAVPATAPPLRIGLLAPPWLPVPPPAYGGIESAVDLLARGLAAAGHDVVLFAAAESTCPVARRSAGPAAPRALLGMGALELATVVAGYETLGDCDVVHDHTLLGPLVASLRSGGPPSVVTAHGLLDGHDAAMFRTVSGRVPVIAISHRQARRSPVPVSAVIHHAVDTDRIQPGPGDGGYVAFLGRMAPEKGVARAVRLARRAGVPLRIAAKMSEPGEFAYFESAVRPLLGGDVAYVGALGRDEASELLRGAAALLNPIAWEEPFGLVMIEALAAGTPVLTSPVGAAPEIVRDGVTGRLCDDDDAFVAALGDLGSIERHRCRVDALLRFSPQRLVREHLDLYRRVLVGRAGPLPLPGTGSLPGPGRRPAAG